MTSDLLQRILATKSEEIAAAKKLLPFPAARSQAESLRADVRDFAAALERARHRQRPAVIAEIKKASPSRGLLREDFHPDAIAKEYAHHGADCLSVLTDEKYFQAEPEYLMMARAACPLPALRKDFMIAEYQIYQSLCLGADAVLLIVAALPDDGRMSELAAIARSLNLSILVEVHDSWELERALRLESPLLGINNRNLRTFEVDLQTTLNLLPEIPKNKTVISESGVRTPEDVARLSMAGVHGFLVGETFMKAPSPGQALATLFSRTAHNANVDAMGSEEHF